MELTNTNMINNTSIHLQEPSRCDLIKNVYDLVRQNGDRLGFRVKDVLPQTWHYIENLSLTRAQKVRQSLSDFNQLCSSIEITDTELNDPIQFMRTTLHYSKLKVPEEFLQRITHEDLVEGYNLEGIQIVRNEKFMEMCGYSLVEILSYEWQELYERSQQITNIMIEKIGQTLKMREGIVAAEVKPHFMKERFSFNRQVSEISFNAMAPMFNLQDELAGFVISCRARILDDNPSRHELRFI